MLPLTTRLLAVALIAAAVACGGRLERKSSDDAESSARPAPVEAADAAEDTPSDAAGEGSGFSSEAERTRAMEAQAADLKRQFEDAVANAATEEEKLRAYQEFEQGRQELDEMSDDDLGDGDDAYAPPPDV